jgi:Putative auto-transporter adhesin, head GIN domain
MKKIITSVILIYLCLLCVPSFAEEKSYSFKDFTEIEFSTAGSLYLTQSDQYRVVLEGAKEQIEDIVIQQNGNLLVIKQEWSLFGLGDVDLNGITVRIDVPKLEAITASNSGSIHGQTRFANLEGLKIVTSSSGDISLSAKAESVEVISSSSGSIRLDGTITSLSLETGSSGNIAFSGVITEKLSATTTSMGKIRCDLISNTIVPESRLKISSMGNIIVSGMGKHVEASSSSAGNFLLKDFQCEEMKIDLTSSGNAVVNVTGTLDMNTSSSGRIKNQGSPLMN